MAKARTTVTTSWQQIAAGAAVFTVEKVGAGHLLFNETQADETAYRDRPSQNDQFEQRSDVTTYVKATGDGWEIIADGSL